jgi:hypothetical protein
MSLKVTKPTTLEVSFVGAYSDMVEFISTMKFEYDGLNLLDGFGMYNSHLYRAKLHRLMNTDKLSPQARFWTFAILSKMPDPGRVLANLQIFKEKKWYDSVRKFIEDRIIKYTNASPTQFSGLHVASCAPSMAALVYVLSKPDCDVAAFLSNKWAAQLALNDNMQAVQKNWETEFWKTVVTTTKKPGAKEFKAEFREDFYNNKAGDRYLLVYPNKTVARNEPYDQTAIENYIEKVVEMMSSKSEEGKEEHDDEPEDGKAVVLPSPKSSSSKTVRKSSSLSAPDSSTKSSSSRFGGSTSKKSKASSSTTDTAPEKPTVVAELATSKTDPDPEIAPLTIPYVRSAVDSNLWGMEKYTNFRKALRKERDTVKKGEKLMDIMMGLNSDELVATFVQRSQLPNFIDYMMANDTTSEVDLVDHLTSQYTKQSKKRHSWIQPI